MYYLLRTAKKKCFGSKRTMKIAIALGKNLYGKNKNSTETEWRMFSNVSSGKWQTKNTQLSFFRFFRFHDSVAEADVALSIQNIHIKRYTVHCLHTVHSIQYIHNQFRLRHRNIGFGPWSPSILNGAHILL